MPLTCINAIIFAAILAGIPLRRRSRRLHANWMRTCFVLDLLLLAMVEFSGASAVGEATRRVMDSGDGQALTIVHVCFAITGLVLWICQLVVGAKLLRGQTELRRRHLTLVFWFLLARIGNVITAFMIV